MGKWCCHWPILYKALPHLHICIAFIEFICGIIRIVLFFSPLPPKSSTVQYSYSQTASASSVPQNYSSQYVAAFAIDWISSIVPTLSGLFVTLLILVVLCKMLAHISNNDPKNQVHPSDQIDTTGWFRKFWNNKALRRVIALDCNCPCYRPRPKLRFQVRLIFFFFILSLRIVAIALYASSSIDGNRAAGLVILTVFTLICLVSTFFLDIYHYCVWWHYTPYLDTTCFCCRSRQHTRYLPYILVGEYRNEQLWGDRSCSQNPCLKRRLEHIATFHSSTYQPQARWTELQRPEFLSDPEEKPRTQPTYIGFHTTKAENAVKIAKGGFLPSSRGMLGPGVYFARSLEATIGKVGLSGGHGAWIVAEIRMGKVHVTHRNSINPKIVTGGAWRDTCDTCYCVHPDDNLDEFCIKDPEKQIIKWIIIIKDEHDPKVKKLGLDTEFNSTEYGCF